MTQHPAPTTRRQARDDARLTAARVGGGPSRRRVVASLTAAAVAGSLVAAIAVGVQRAQGPDDGASALTTLTDARSVQVGGDPLTPTSPTSPTSPAASPSTLATPSIGASAAAPGLLPSGASSGTAPATDPAANPATNPAANPATNPVADPPATGTGAERRRGWVYAIARTPSDTELDAMARRYGVIVLNQWNQAALRRIKQVDPSVIVLMYQCLSSTRTADDPTHRSGGVLYSAAPASWFATDTAGRRIPWTPYPGHWQMAVWDGGYQQAWVANVVRDVVDGGWDGVLADNDMSTLGWYNDAVISGQSSRAATDALLRRSLTTLIDTAGPALNAKGKLLVPNISDGRLYPGRWAAHSRYGGGMEENYAHWGTSSGDGFVGDWGADGWTAQQSQVGASGLTLAHTGSSRDDRRTQLYGYASVLVGGDADAYWTPSWLDQAGYGSEPTLTESTWATGPARAAATRTAGGAWTRQFAAVWAAVNPTTSSVTVTAPAGSRAADGSPVGTVTLGPYSGLVVRTS